MNKRKKKIRLLLVDDHPVVRRGMRSCLEGIRHVEVVDEAVDGKEAMEKVKALTPDIVLHGHRHAGTT